MDNRAGQSSGKLGHGAKEELLSKPAKGSQADECSSLTSGAGSQNNEASYQSENDLNIGNSLAGWGNQWNQTPSVGDVASGGDTTSNVGNDSSQGDQDRQNDQEGSSTQSIPESDARDLARELEDRIKGDEISPAELVNSLDDLRRRSSASGGEEND